MRRAPNDQDRAVVMAASGTRFGRFPTGTSTPPGNDQFSNCAFDPLTTAITRTATRPNDPAHFDLPGPASGVRLISAIPTSVRSESPPRRGATGGIGIGTWVERARPVELLRSLGLPATCSRRSAADWSDEAFFQWDRAVGRRLVPRRHPGHGYARHRGFARARQRAGPDPAGRGRRRHRRQLRLRALGRDRVRIPPGGREPTDRRRQEHADLHSPAGLGNGHRPGRPARPDRRAAGGRRGVRGVSRLAGDGHRRRCVDPGGRRRALVPVRAECLCRRHLRTRSDGSERHSTHCP